MIYSRKVFFYETDAQGIVHHSNYARYLEEARGYYLDSIGYGYEKVREELGIDIVLTHLSVNYKKPLRFGDRFEIHFGISQMDRFKFTFDYQILCKGELIATATTKHVCIDRKTGRIVSVPDVLKVD